MHNHPHSFLVNKKLLQLTQFSFQEGHSTEHVIAQLVDEIHESFENDNYTLGVFIDSSKAFDTIDHTILLKKLENNEIKGTNLAWFRSYLINRKQYIQIIYDQQKRFTKYYMWSTAGLHSWVVAFFDLCQ